MATDVNLNDPNGDPAWDANVLSRDSGDGLLRSTVEYMKRVIFHYQATKYGKMVDIDMCMKMKCDLLKVKENVDYALERIDALEALAVQVGLHPLPRTAPPRTRERTLGLAAWARRTATPPTERWRVVRDARVTRACRACARGHTRRLGARRRPSPLLGRSTTGWRTPPRTTTTRMKSRSTHPRRVRRPPTSYTTSVPSAGRPS